MAARIKHRGAARAHRGRIPAARRRRAAPGQQAAPGRNAASLHGLQPPQQKISGRSLGAVGGQTLQQVLGVAVRHKLATAGGKVQVKKPSAQQQTKIIDAAQIRISGSAAFQSSPADRGAAEVRVVGQLQHHRGVVGAGAAQMLVHDAQDVQLVRVAHHIGGQRHPLRHAGRQGKAVVQGHGGQNNFAQGFVCQTAFTLEDAHAQLPVVAGIPVAKRMVAQILLKPAYIVVQGGQQAGAGQRRRERLGRHNALGVGQHGLGVGQLQIQGSRIPVGTRRLLGPFPRRIGGKPGLVPADVLQSVHARSVRRVAPQGNGSSALRAVPPSAMLFFAFEGLLRVAPRSFYSRLFRSFFMADFVHLHCHTEYSLLDGAIRIKDLCARAKDYGMPACAVTDHGNLFAAAYFYRTCKDFGIKPIVGCEVYVCHDHKDKSPDSPLARTRHHLILLAQNTVGYHNLVKLVSQGYLEGFYYKPRVDKAQLRKYSEGLICLSACIAGEIPRAVIKDNDMDKALRLTREYADIYPGRFYLELQSNGLKEQEVANTALMELAETTGLPLVATNDCHYLNADDAEAHEVLLCIQTQTTMDDPNRMRFGTHELYYKSVEEMEKPFAHVPEALANTLRIAEQCQVEMDFGHHYFPVYALPQGASLESEFRRLAEEGLERRLEKHPDREHIDPQAYRDRLQYELKVIIEMGFPGYFLIVQEFINWAKNHHVPVGPGRGSAAGSLVAWALRITNLDPLPYNLLFERFLNNERVSLPDIDVDFCERRRGDVIRHMVDTYGEGSVAQITTFGTMKAKGVVRDVGRALGMSFAETDRIAKLVPADLKMTIQKALEMEPDLEKIYREDPKVTHLLDTARRLEGLARHASTHAAGLVVSDKPMVEYLPLYQGKRGELVTQFDGPMTEKVGLVKFDFLGLKTMTLIQDTLDNISLQGQTPPDLDNLPLTDAATYDLYARGDTDGVFQVESSGMRQYLRMLKPTCFEDVIAMLALYRPGPLGSGMVDEFIKRKHGQVPVVYPHDSLQECLRDTYGVIVYQEQVMQIAQIIASYTLGGADLLRRAMGKKKAEAMAKERVTFVAGAEKNGIGKDKANEIFDLMEKFAEYGFNKSHSAAYALISYYTAYLKVHYKVEFMAALLTSEMGNQDKLLKYVSCCKDMGIDVVQPSVNQSQREFTAHNGQVVFGLGGIKNVGDEAIRELVEARKTEGGYTSLLDLCCRVNLRKVTKRVLESLVKGGACDCFNVPRAAMLAALDLVVSRAQKKAKEKSSNQVSLLAMAPALEAKPLPGIGLDCPEAQAPEMSDDDKLKGEKEALGFFLTSHPLLPFIREMRRLNLTTLEDARELFPGAELRCAALVVSLKEVITKSRGERMAFVGIEDLTGHAEVTFFPRSYAECRSLLQSEQPLCLTARLDSQNDAADNRDMGDEEEDAPRELKLLGQSVRPLAEACGDSDTPVCVQIPPHRLGREDMLTLRSILESHPGPVEAQAQICLDGHVCLLLLDSALKVRPGPELDKALSAWAS